MQAILPQSSMNLSNAVVKQEVKKEVKKGVYSSRQRNNMSAKAGSKVRGVNKN